MDPYGPGEESESVSTARVLRVWERYTQLYGVGMTHEMHGDVQPGIPWL